MNLQTLLADWGAALERGDGDFFARALADDFVFINAGGGMGGKDAFLRAYAPYRRRVFDLRPRDYGDTAALVYRVHTELPVLGRGMHGYFRGSVVFVRRGDTWWAVLAQMTPLEMD